MKLYLFVCFTSFSFFCFSQNKCVKYIKSKTFINKHTEFYFNQNIIRSIDSETSLYLVWIKETPFKENKIDIIRQINNCYKQNNCNLKNANKFYYTVQLYLIDIYSNRYKVMSDLVYYDIAGEKLMGMDIDADVDSWIYSEDSKIMRKLFPQIKEYIENNKL